MVPLHAYGYWLTNNAHVISCISADEVRQLANKRSLICDTLFLYAVIFLNIFNASSSSYAFSMNVQSRFANFLL